MTRSMAMLLLASLLTEVVPFGWLFVTWAIVAAIPVLAFGSIYLALWALASCAGGWLAAALSHAVKALRPRRKE